MNKLWFGSSMRPYPGGDPPFYNPDEFEWARKMEENWHIIRNEVSPLIDEKSVNKVPTNCSMSTSLPIINGASSTFFGAQKYQTT